jgi:hypothetical protein
VPGCKKNGRKPDIRLDLIFNCRRAWAIREYKGVKIYLKDNMYVNSTRLRNHAFKALNLQDSGKHKGRAN